MLPKDPDLLLSVVNTRLRDLYPTLDALCDAEDVQREQIEALLSDAGYVYDEGKNRFV